MCLCISFAGGPPLIERFVTQLRRVGSCSNLFIGELIFITCFQLTVLAIGFHTHMSSFPALVSQSITQRHLC